MSVRERYRKVKVKKLRKKEQGSTLKIKPLPIKKRLKRKKLYVKEKCHFHDDKGIRCTHNAIGSGQLCETHGGEKDRTNVLSPEATQLYLAIKGKRIKFNPGIHPLQMIDLSRQGMSDVEIAAEMGVGVETLRGWSDQYQEFSTAYEIGQALHESWWLTKGKAGLDSRNFNTGLFKYLTGNKLGYADKVETKNLNMAVCGVLVAPAKQSIDEWEASGNIKTDQG